MSEFEDFFENPLKHYADDTIDLFLQAICTAYSVKATVFQINQDGRVAELEVGVEGSNTLCYFARTSVCHVDPVLHDAKPVSVSECVIISSDSDSDFDRCENSPSKTCVPDVDLSDVSGSDTKHENVIVEYFNANLCLPIFRKGDTPSLPTKEIGLKLITSNIPLEKISTTTPLYVHGNA